jgi:regulator of replication initiation timing
MSETTLPRSKRKTRTDDKAIITQMFAEIDRLNQQMVQDQADIDRLKIETDLLRSETLRLKSETRAILTRLGATL